MISPLKSRHAEPQLVLSQPTTSMKLNSITQHKPAEETQRNILTLPALCPFSSTTQALITTHGFLTEATLTNIDDIGGQEVAAGKAGSAHIRISVRGHGSPGPQGQVGRVGVHGHPGCHRLHHC